MPSAASERLIRLAGDGKNRGGGLPLPPLFHAITSELLDRGPLAADDLIRPVEDWVPKPERVDYLYPTSGYAGLVTDALEQLASRGLAVRENGRWALTDKLRNRLGQNVAVIPRRRGMSERIGIVVHAKADRDRLSAEANEDHELRSMYSDMQNERLFEVGVAGVRGGVTVRKLRLHALARAIPQMTLPEFMELGKNIRAYGVKVPVVLFNGEVLDGRHRAAAAAALQVPIRVEDFEGDEVAARDHVVSLNLMRRDLTMAQRALIVLELYLPQAEVEAAERVGGRPSENLSPTGDGPIETARAVAVAATRSHGLASARTLSRILPIRNAPLTQAAVRRGEIKSALGARTAALKETGAVAPADVPAAMPEPPYTALGDALRKVTKANTGLADGSPGSVEPVRFRGRIAELRAAIDETERLVAERT